MGPKSAAPAMAMLGDGARLKSLLSPLRRTLLEGLLQPESATSLAHRLGLARQKVNYHLRELERAGFIELAEERQRRGCVERCYRATARAYTLDPALLGRLAVDPEAIQDRFSSAYLVALASRMVREVAELRAGAEAAGKPLATLALHADVRFRSAAERTAFAAELAAEVARLAAKYHHDAPSARAFRFVVGGHPVPKPAAPVPEHSP